MLCSRRISSHCISSHCHTALSRNFWLHIGTGCKGFWTGGEFHLNHIPLTPLGNMLSHLWEYTPFLKPSANLFNVGRHSFLRLSTQWSTTLWIGPVTYDFVGSGETLWHRGQRVSSHPIDPASPTTWLICIALTTTQQHVWFLWWSALNLRLNELMKTVLPKFVPCDAPQKNLKAKWWKNSDRQWVNHCLTIETSRLYWWLRMERLLAINCLGLPWCSLPSKMISSFSTARAPPK